MWKDLFCPGALCAVLRASFLSSPGCSPRGPPTWPAPWQHAWPAMSASSRHQHGLSASLHCSCFSSASPLRGVSTFPNTQPMTVSPTPGGFLRECNSAGPCSENRVSSSEIIREVHSGEDFPGIRKTPILPISLCYLAKVHSSYI